MPAELCAPPSVQPRFVAIPSIRITAASHRALPLALKPLYSSRVLGALHNDKLSPERVLVQVREIPKISADQVKPEVLADGWQDTSGLPKEGEIGQVVVSLPALLTNRECRGDQKKSKKSEPYRTLQDGDFGHGYRVLRKDGSYLIVCDALPNWER